MNDGALKNRNDAPSVRPKPTVLACLFLGMFVPLLLNGFYNGILIRSPFFYWTVELVTWVLVPCGLLYVYRRMGGAYRDLGLVCPRSVGEVCTVVLLVCIWAVILVGAFRGGQSWGESIFERNYLKLAFNYGSLIPDSGWRATVIWIYFSLTAGIVEELFFRGMLRRIFGPGWRSTVFFVVVSTVLFSVIHWENGVNDLLATGAVGLLVGICYVWHRTILIPMIAHAVANLVLFW